MKEVRMACEQSRDKLDANKLDAYVDGELDPAEANALGSHLRECAACASDVLERVQMKRSVQIAGKRYAPSAEFRNRITRSVAAKPRHEVGWYWKILAVPALSLLLLTLAVNLYVGRESARRQRVYSELADLHVSSLASSAPVDVVSTDRHTVKPWFQGKIPFTFNLPELPPGSEFTLLGGRVTYLAQTPGAHLIYQVRKHDVSVFIFMDRGEEIGSLPSGPSHALSFNVENWTQNGLRYFVVGDVSQNDIQALSELLRAAG
jgi:anti-sigma factor RsiW